MGSLRLSESQSDLRGLGDGSHLPAALDKVAYHGSNDKFW